MLGWKTYSFGELQLVHHRVTGTADGLLRDKVKHGVACYVSAYHPLFVLASCMVRLMQKPYVIGSAAICFGFLKGYVTRMSRVSDQSYVTYIRRQQLRRLCGMQTIWH
jgi:poly-beta-1,6-N-acetyl-D-glucosamine synthase